MYKHLELTTVDNGWILKYTTKEYDAGDPMFGGEYLDVVKTQVFESNESLVKFLTKYVGE